MIKKIIIAILLLLYPALSFAHRIDTDIEGRVFTEAGPMHGAKVYVYKKYSDINSGRHFTVSGPSGVQGVYKLKLPPGEYYFTAGGEYEGKNYYAYHGNNPIKVEKENIWIALMTTEVKPPVYSNGDMVIKGVVTYKGEPVKDAYIALYTPETKSFKGLGFRTESIDKSGTFNVPLLEGRYVVLAKKMLGDNMIRPLKEGDLYCYYSQNPVEVRSGKTVEIEVPCYPKAERISFVDTPMIKSNDYVDVIELTDRFTSGFKGRVTDLDGNPAAGLHVFAYRSRSPVFLTFHVSQGSEYIGKSDKNGYYSIPVDSDGEFHIVARSRLGRAPQGGDVYGVYDGSPNYRVRFKKGHVVDNIDIMVGKSGGGKTGPVQGEVTEIDSRDYKTDHIIDRNTLWKGNITVNGRVSVKRGVTLTIAPGTTVRFRRLDQDENRVGDGEIMVQGRLIAKGTKDRRIVFRSAENKPQAKDWSYILLLSSDAESIFEYCEFRHAFSGIQALYSNARISDSLFMQNHEGIRFTRANVTLEHNGFFDNDTAIRHTIIEGDVVINNNHISRNDIGIIFRQSHINTVNFSKPFEVTEHLEVRDNNILNNRDYNVKLGDGQVKDVKVTGNWWGSGSKELIDDLIFDKKQDSELGYVVYSPYHEKPVNNAGVRDKL